ncbi:hypothetical protein BH10ACT3_BH10ACT3_07930 [soil metagenome]
MALHEFRNPMIGYCLEAGGDDAPPRAILEIRPSETTDVLEISLDPVRLRELAASCIAAADDVDRLRNGETIDQLRGYEGFGPAVLTTADLPMSFRA